MPPKVIVVLPAYNERANIGNLLDALDRAMTDGALNYQAVAVDDGSTDGTREILADYGKRVPLTVLHHSVNQGLGATIRDGLEWAAAAAGPADIVVTMDADGSHSPALILRMADLIREGAGVVIASRYQPGGRVLGVSWTRRCLSFGASWLLRVVFPTAGVRDFTCGYRAYRAVVLKNAFDRYGRQFVDQAGFQCMVDILLKLRRMKTDFSEVPLVLRYDLKESRSKMKVLRTIRDTVYLLARRRLGL